MGKKIINYSIMAAALTAMVLVWPLGLFRQEYSNRSNAGNYFDSGFIKGSTTLIQTFVPEQDYLKSISLQVSRENTFQHGYEGELTFSLYSEEGSMLMSTTEELNTVVSKNYQTFEIGRKLEKGKNYYFEITAEGSDSEGPTVRFIEKEDNGLSENATLSYAGAELPQFSAVTVYTYEKTPGILGTAAYYCWILTIGGIAWQKGGRQLVGAEQ